jgi:hypothetical protein
MVIYRNKMRTSIEPYADVGRKITIIAFHDEFVLGHSGRYVWSDVRFAEVRRSTRQVKMIKFASRAKLSTGVPQYCRRHPCTVVARSRASTKESVAWHISIPFLSFRHTRNAHTYNGICHCYIYIYIYILICFYFATKVFAKSSRQEISNQFAMLSILC